VYFKNESKDLSQLQSGHSPEVHSGALSFLYRIWCEVAIFLYKQRSVKAAAAALWIDTTSSLLLLLLLLPLLCLSKSVMRVQVEAYTRARTQDGTDATSFVSLFQTANQKGDVLLGYVDASGVLRLNPEGKAEQALTPQSVTAFVTISCDL